MAFLNARKAQTAALTDDEYAKRCKQRAVKFREQSDSARDPSARSIFLRLAAMYQDMANQFAAAADTHKGGKLPGTAITGPGTSLAQPGRGISGAATRSLVVPGLGPGIHELLGAGRTKALEGGDKCGSVPRSSRG